MADLRSHGPSANADVKDLAEHPSKTNWGNGQTVSVKLTVDARHGNRKLMAFFNPNKLKAIGEWHK